MTTHFYKFVSEQTFLETISEHLVDGVVPSYIGAAAVHVVGVIQKPTGETVDTDDVPVPVLEPIDGWHVNTSAPIDRWKLFEVSPSNPSCVFAGA